MLKLDVHKRALEKLDKLIDPTHVEACERLQCDLWAGKELDYMPCIITYPLSKEEWPKYDFVECWDDMEKNLVSSLFNVYCGATVKDDSLYVLRPEYGVVNIPELFGIKTVISNEGNSMSEGLNNVDKIKDLIQKGVPDLRSGHGKKVEEYEDFAKSVLSEYENLSKHIHLMLPDTQGPFDLACLLWGSSILMALHDEPQVIEQLMELVTETFIQYNLHHKARIGEPLDSGYHICGLKLVRGGIRICEDSATLISGEMYADMVKKHSAKALDPFDGGWVHYCGNGSHIIDDIIDLPGTNVVHLGNPDYHDFLGMYSKLASNDIVLYWSGALEELPKLKEQFGLRRILVLVENRYAPKDAEDAKRRLALVRDCKPIEKALY